MKIIPQPNKVYLKLDEVKLGNLDTSSINTAVEFAEVIGVGEGITNLKKGDKIFVKAWAIDIVNFKDKKYFFCDIDTKGILAVIKD